MSEDPPQVRPPYTFGRRAHRHGQVFANTGSWGLQNLMEQTLDPGYQRAADRRRAGHRGLDRREVSLLMAVGLLLIGATITIAYRTQRDAVPAQVQTREALVASIDQRRASVAESQGNAADLRLEVEALQADALTGTNEALLDQVQQLQLTMGLTAATGPGVVIVVGEPDPEGNDPVGGTNATATDVLISDLDLARAVNSLWEVGAEAIAINGQRIGPATPIRQAGGAILVNFLPVASPYTIDVIGDNKTLAADFAGTDAGRRFATYRNAYAATFTVTSSDSLTLAAGPEPSTTYAEPIGAK